MRCQAWTRGGHPCLNLLGSPESTDVLCWVHAAVARREAQDEQQRVRAEQLWIDHDADQADQRRGGFRLVTIDAPDWA